MRCLVVGGAGFIGRWTVAALLERGDEAWVLDDLSNGRTSNLDALREHRGFGGFHRGSTTHPGDLDLVFDGAPWDAVIHLGMAANVQGSLDHPLESFRNDVEGSVMLMDACRRQTAPPRFVFVSSSLVYAAASSAKMTEEHPCRPASPFAGARLAVEALVQAYAHGYGLPATIVRPFNTYGPFQKTADGGVVAAFLKRDLDRVPIQIKGTGEQRRDLLYVEDFADLLVRAAATGTPSGAIVNGGSGDDVSVRQLAMLCATGGTDVRLVPHDHPQAEVARQCADVTKAARLLGWTPRVSLAEGLARTRAWLRLHPDA